MSDLTMEVKPCPICGSQPRYWEWNFGAIVECWCEGHRIQCEAKTLGDAIGEWNRRAYEEPIKCCHCIYWDRDTIRHQSNDFRDWNEAECKRLAERDGYNEINRYTEADDYCSRGDHK